MRRKSSPSPNLPQRARHDRTPARTGKSDGPETIHQNRLALGLYVTATPIGNARDITLRALDVLAHCDVIAAEDTRVSAKLLAIHGISRPLVSYNDHNAREMRPRLLARLANGERVALISDAGTPTVSDPGMKLVREARAAGYAVYPVPGSSAVLAALAAAGLPTDRFLFAGFLPPKSGERRTALGELKGVPSTLVFFESPQRLSNSLADMAEVLGDREAAVARELTKLHEEVRTGSLAALAAAYDEPPKGEITIVVAPPADAAPDTAKAESLLRQALPFMPVKSAANLVAEATGASRREVYDMALSLKGNDGAK
jgi:16S rRNA (cytidine1402-2'-O)-methyltransferase